MGRTLPKHPPLKLLKSRANHGGQAPVIGFQWDQGEVPSFLRATGPSFGPVALVMFVAGQSP